MVSWFYHCKKYLTSSVIFIFSVRNKYGGCLSWCWSFFTFQFWYCLKSFTKTCGKRLIFYSRTILSQTKRLKTIATLSLFSMSNELLCLIPPVQTIPAGTGQATNTEPNSPYFHSYSKCKKKVSRTASLKNRFFRWCFSENYSSQESRVIILIKLNFLRPILSFTSRTSFIINILPT